MDGVLQRHRHDFLGAVGALINDSIFKKAACKLFYSLAHKSPIRWSRMMRKDHGERVPEPSRRSTATAGGVYLENDAGRNAVRQGGRWNKENRKAVSADPPHCVRRDAKVECELTPRLADGFKYNGVRDEFQQRRPQTSEPSKHYGRGGVQHPLDGDYSPRPEYHRVNHHERTPRRTREEAPKLCGFLQYERSVGRGSRADTTRFVSSLL